MFNTQPHRESEPLQQPFSRWAGLTILVLFLIMGTLIVSLPREHRGEGYGRGHGCPRTSSSQTN